MFCLVQFYESVMQKRAETESAAVEERQDIDKSLLIKQRPKLARCLIWELALAGRPKHNNSQGKRQHPINLASKTNKLT